MSGAATETGKGNTETPPKTDDAAAAAAAAAAAEAAKKTTETTTEKKTETTETGKGKEPPASGAPEKYSLSIPDDGKDVFDADDLKQIETAARAEGLTNDEAQALVKEHIASVKAATATFLAETKADADYGGEKLAETQRLAGIGLELIRPKGHPRHDSFIKLMKRAGYENHIEVVSFLADLGKRASEDGTGGTSAGLKPTSKTVEQRLYDNTPTTDGGSKA